MAPALIDIEVLSTFRSLVAAELVTADRARLAVGELAGAAVRRAPHAYLLTRCWELRHNVTPYDAAYMALAEITGIVAQRVPLAVAGQEERRSDATRHASAVSKQVSA